MASSQQPFVPPQSARARVSEQASAAGEHPEPRRVALLVEQRYLPQAQPAGLRDALLDAGHRVHVVVTDPRPAAESLPPWTDVDIVVARGRGTQMLALLREAMDEGVPVVNAPSSIAGVLDKRVTGRRLEDNGLPTPRTRFGLPRDLADDEWRFPVICKPVRGGNARGIQVVATRRQLERLDWPEPVAVVQEFVPGGGRDLTLYGAGSTVWAVRRPSPLLDSPTHLPEPVPATTELRRIALRCAEAFDLDLYGVDCLLTPDGPVVLEVNDFPNYTGVDGASRTIADHVVRTALTSRTELATANPRGHKGLTRASR